MMSLMEFALGVESCGFATVLLKPPAPGEIRTAEFNLSKGN